MEEMAQQLAHEKLERTTAQAELDAVKSQKPDTTEVDAVKSKLSSLEKTHASALEKADANLAAARQEAAAIKEDLLMAQKEVETLRLEAEAKEQTHDADFKDMHDSLTQIAEQEKAKADALEAKIADVLKKAAESDKTLSEVMSRVADAEEKAEGLARKLAAQEKVVDELEAKIKVKDAELAEAKASPSPPVPRTSPCSLKTIVPGTRTVVPHQHPHQHFQTRSTLTPNTDQRRHRFQTQGPGSQQTRRRGRRRRRRGH
jgi:chromosome segregation ATPase